MSTPSGIKTWHHDTYDAISPTRPELSAAGKTVVITGAGSGIGRETALAFASAGATHIALLGRRDLALKETAEAIAAKSPHVKVSIHSIDISDEKALPPVVQAIGQWDTLIHAAGHFSAPTKIADTDISDYWKAFEINTKGTLVVLQGFAKTVNRGNASVIAITTGAAAAPAAFVPTFSSYMASKIAQIKIVENFAAENPDIASINLHPGFVETDIFKATGADASQLPMDTVQLPAHFSVWLSSPEARFLTGRSVSANWDVTEIKAKADGLAQSADWVSTITAWQFSASA